uniref:Uncharacterized protein n=1 Tax=Glossina pallidipes TaxID=7398 RepID=A0A1A9ZDH3_GLOPL
MYVVLIDSLLTFFLAKLLHGFWDITVVFRNQLPRVLRNGEADHVNRIGQSYGGPYMMDVCNNKATPANVHLPGLSLVFKLKVHTHILSNGNSLRRAVLCIIAVNKDWGLKKPANQTQEGNYNKRHDVSMSRSKFRNSSFEAKLQIPPHDKLERKSTGLVTCGLMGKRKRKSNSVDKTSPSSGWPIEFSSLVDFFRNGSYVAHELHREFESKSSILACLMHRPAAAPDLVRTNSGSNSGSFKYGAIALITSPCMFSLSESRNVSTLAIAILAAFHERSLGNLPPGDKSTITAAVTLVTIPGGEPNDFSSLFGVVMAGNFLARIRNVEPTGEKHKTIFNCLRTRSIKNFQQFSRESTRPAPLTSLRTPAMIFSISSSGNRSGISPVDSISLIRTRKSSLGI